MVLTFTSVGTFGQINLSEPLFLIYKIRIKMKYYYINNNTWKTVLSKK